MRHRPLRPSSARRMRTLAGIALLGLLLAALACAGRHGPGHRHGHHGFTSDTSIIQVVSALIGGKNVFIPSTIVVTSGHPVKLSIFNTTDTAHGFAIHALDIAVVLPPQQEYELELPALEGHQVLQINCQLHPAHRTATLVVLPARRSKD
jgi:cupredoxin-like protein